MKSTLKIAVIVPTYNHPDLVFKSMRSLQKQTISVVEIIVVDNSADGQLEARIDHFNQSAKFRVTYLKEPRLGLHYARHNGARYSDADILVFTDDDATFHPGWLKAYEKAFTENPAMVAAGGPVRPHWDIAPPQWLLDYMDNAKLFPILSLMEPYDEFKIKSENFFFGVNMAIRRKVLFNVGGFNPELIGNITYGDGESGLNRKLRKRGMLIGFVPEAIVYHHIPSHRMTIEYIRKWAWHLGGAKMFQRLQGRIPSAFGLIGEAIRIIAMKGLWWLILPFVWNRTSRFSLTVQLRAVEGWCSINYLWWVNNRKLVRQFLVTKDFISEKVI